MSNKTPPQIQLSNEVVNTDCKKQADQLRAFADDVEAGKVHGFLLGSWNGYTPSGYSHSITAVWENPDPKIAPCCTQLVGISTVLQDLALREWRGAAEHLPRGRKLDG